MAGNLIPWKGKFLTCAGCTELVKSVLSAIPIFLLTITKIDKVIIRALDQLKRGMLWANKLVEVNARSVGSRFVHRNIGGGEWAWNSLEKFTIALRL
jgi:hypothetical protein